MSNVIGEIETRSLLVQMDKISLSWVIFLWVFWVILTADLRPLNLLFGLVVASFITYLSSGLLKGYIETFTMSLRRIWRFFLCLLRLIFQIVKANTDVGERVLDPKLPISPAIVKFKSNLPGVLPKVILAAFITLRPGTLAVDFEGDTIYVHCLADEFARELMERELEGVVSWIFKEGK